MMIVAIIAGMGMMLGLVGCGGKSESEIKADIEKTAIETVQNNKMPGADETYSVEKCEINGDKAECTVVDKDKEGKAKGKTIVKFTKMGDNWAVTGMSSQH